MADEFYSLVTDIGTVKQTESIRDGIPFDVSYIALGDSNGEYYEPDTAQTQLVHEVWRGNIEKCEWGNNKFYCITSVPADIGGFTVREAGVFDSNNNLLVITKFPETVKQSPASGTIKQLVIRIEMELSNAELADLIVNPNVILVSKDEFNTKITEYQKLSEKGQAQGYAPLDNNTKIPVQFIPDLKSMLTPFCVNSCPLDAKGNPALMSFNNNTITIQAPFIYTTADNKTYTVQNNLTLNAAPLTPMPGNTADFNIFIKETSNGFNLEVYSNNIYAQNSAPSNPNPNDIWLKTIEPLASYIYISNEWQETSLVPIGSFTLSN